jgi:hypothetical protein
MSLDKLILFKRYARENKSSGAYEYRPGVEPPMCGICGKRITVAELTGGQFEAVQSRGGYMTHYHTTCLGMEAGSHD